MNDDPDICACTRIPRPYADIFWCYAVYPGTRYAEVWRCSACRGFRTLGEAISFKKNKARHEFYGCYSYEAEQYF